MPTPSYCRCANPVPYEDTEQYGHTRRCWTCGKLAPIVIPASCRKCRREVHFPADGTGLLKCPCGIDLLIVELDGSHRTPGYDPIRDTASMACCLNCRQVVAFPLFGRGQLKCPCGAVLAILSPGGSHQLLPSEAPPDLTCKCCKRVLPFFAFSIHNGEGAKSRGYRAFDCRGCMAIKRRAKRETQIANETPEEREARLKRLRDEQAAKRERMTPEQLEAARKANVPAAKRAYARRQGRDVPIQRRGTLGIVPGCRIVLTCPLARFCVDKVAAGRAVVAARC